MNGEGLGRTVVGRQHAGEPGRRRVVAFPGLQSRNLSGPLLFIERGVR